MVAATGHQEREGIQQRLEEVDGNIQSCKNSVHHFEGKANQDGEELKQLERTIREEGLFCVEWCLVLSVSTVNCEDFIVKLEHALRAHRAIYRVAFVCMAVLHYDFDDLYQS